MMASIWCASISDADQLLVADIADDAAAGVGTAPSEAGRQIVEHDHALAGIEQLEHHVAADVAGAAGDENGHRPHPCDSTSDRYPIAMKERLFVLHKPVVSEPMTYTL